MDLPIHDQILWYACKEAERRLGANAIASPTACYPYLVCGSWMNDMNQSSIFTEFISGTTKDVDNSFAASAAIDGAFKVLWIQQLDAMLERMKNGSPGAAAAADAFMKTFPDALEIDSTATASFGKYCRYDHLDVLENTAESENAKWNGASQFVSGTIQETFSYVKYSLLHSTLHNEPDKRISRDHVIALGRTLHTCADFYAHSNYVELLLWGQAFGGRLKQNIIDEFNDRSRFPLYREKIYPFCPLPTKQDDLQALLSVADDDNFYRVLWYGGTPDLTPLSSCRFLFTDTAYSLLMMYATHLERISVTALDNDGLDLAMAVFNVPGKDVIGRFYKVYREVAGVLQTIGKMAREFLADRLLAMGTTADPTTKGMLEATASIVRSYDSAEAGEWARAGRLKYVAYTLLKDMAAPLAKQDAAVPILPHHSLLCKDYPPGFVSDLLRYRLACLFATEVTTEILMMHFSKTTPEEHAYWDIAHRYFIHPSMQMQTDRRLNPVRPLLDEGRLNAWINDGLLGNWWDLARNGNVIHKIPH